MREILFKGKPVLYQSIWIEGSLLQSEIDVNKISVRCEIHERFADNFSITKHAVVPETVCEWIGKYDKNQKRIFENDLVKSNSGDLYLIWICDNGTILYGEVDKSWGDYIHRLDTDYCEVVGNLFDGYRTALMIH